MKRTLSLLLTAALALTLMAGCGPKTPSAGNSASSAPGSSSSQPEDISQPDGSVSEPGDVSAGSGRVPNFMVDRKSVV